MSGRSGTVMIRIGIFGHPIARPLELVDAFLGPDIQSRRSDSEEMGTFRVFVVEAPFAGVDVELSACIPPRRSPEDAFREVLAGCDAGIVLAGAGGWRDQEPTVEALARARAAQPTAIPFVGVVNDFIPPRFEVDPHADMIAAALSADRVVRGRICWWRHERTGTDVVRAAVAAAIELAAPGAVRDR